MSIELQMLAWSGLLGIGYVLLAVAAVTRERGQKWNASARDGAPPPPGLVAGRLQRAQANFFETFPIFAAAALAVVVAGRQDGSTALAVQLYFWARLVYLPLYAAGVPYVRSLAWVVSMAGVFMLLKALL
ncbi:MAPEG family protein [Stenotrophomonas sp. 169]|uniref:MAPEG family protein n=1 Tax=unclassified Stenotrophomonas TaxID=196198 RepID=UPI0016626C5B|nr:MULTISPECIES: MAPEG family protein [unclassified Stenotrophomonas]MBD8634989.1 MAPEG family protein [Stenotrophomonas sp. CFBP 13725]MBD8697436.1 MAPEG family protein [Stenotrophomonas sp. CFBP 13718]QNR99163.1 MAPEG family protein [Stenotrophomonas sp. 169]